MSDETTQEKTTSTADKKSKVIGKINEIKSNVASFVSEINVNELKAKLNTVARDAQKDFNKLVNKDLETVKKKIQKEKTDLEKRAKKLLEGHKKEIVALQARFEKLKAATTKLKSGRGTAKTSGTKKKATKKVATKKATKKSAAKA